MSQILTRIPENLINPLISSISIVVGAIIGGMFSWIITKKSTDRTIEVQNKIVEDNRKYSENVREKKSREYANIIRLDICTALFSSIRVLKAFNVNQFVDIYPIPVDKEYSSGIAYLKNYFQLKEMSYIYQLYGIIEKLNKDTNNFGYSYNMDMNVIKRDFKLFLKKLYGERYREMLEIDIDNIGYEQLYDNDIIKNGYKKVLKQLDAICNK